MKNLVRVLVFAGLFFYGIQIPSIIENYKIGASAVLAELQSDYNKLNLLASRYNMSVEEFLDEAHKTHNQYAQKSVEFIGNKIPRYLLLKKQVELLKKDNLLDTFKIVFLDHDELLYQNVWHTFKLGFYLNLQTSWYFVIFIAAILLTIILETVYRLIEMLLSGRRALS